MPEFLRDPAWQFAGAMFAMLAIFVSLLLYRAEKRRKALSYEILSRTPLLSMAEEIEGKLQILFEGEPVNKVHLVVLRLTNTGNTPIASTDYEREVSFQFADPTRVLTAEVSETNPENLTASLVSSDRKIALKPVLLNKGDSVTIKALLGQFDGTIKADGRIVGVNNIGIRKENPIWVLVTMVGGLVLSVVGFTLYLKSRPEQPPPSTEGLPFLVLALAGYLISVFGMLSRRRYRKLLTRVLLRSVGGYRGEASDSE